MARQSFSWPKLKLSLRVPNVVALVQNGSGSVPIVTPGTLWKSRVTRALRPRPSNTVMRRSRQLAR